MMWYILFLVVLISKFNSLLHKYEDIIQNLSGSTSLCFLENKSNLKLQSITDIVEDHTEIHLLLKVLYYIFYYFIIKLYNINLKLTMYYIYIYI